MSAKQPTEQQIEIARLLGIDAGELAERIALNTFESGSGVNDDGGYRTFCVNHVSGPAALHQLDADQNSNDPRELLAVLGRKVDAARRVGHSQLEAAARDIAATAQRLLEKCLGRHQA